MLNKKKNAFTITELVIVIAVIAILAAVLIPTFSNVIASAKQSAALQVCHNAMTEYISQSTTDDNPNNDNPVGMVFVSDGYAFVYINNQLQTLGTLSGNANVAVLKSGEVNIGELKGISGTGLTSATKLNIKVGEVTEANKGTDFELVNPQNQPNGEELDETYALYVYNITVNGTAYAGYFVINTDEEPTEFVLEGALYAPYTGISAYDGGDSENDEDNNIPANGLTLTVVATTPDPGAEGAGA